MTYIEPAIREEFDPEIDELTESLRERFVSKEVAAGADEVVNYVVTRIIDCIYSNKTYFEYNRALGILEVVKQEYYRRRVAAFETQKAQSNGDIFSGM
jgi:hypothetical protein